jgi:hypothetical protein
VNAALLELRNCCGVAHQNITKGMTGKDRIPKRNGSRRGG